MINTASTDVDGRRRASTSVDFALKIEHRSILSSFTSVDGRKRAWCERTGLLTCVPYWRRRASTSVDGRRRASTDVDALGVNGPYHFSNNNPFYYG